MPKETTEARMLNGELPVGWRKNADNLSIKLVHISTDAVFDGTKSGKYSETDTPHPLSVYAQSKLAGEQAVRQIDQDALVLRVNFYGFSSSGQRSLAEFFCTIWKIVSRQRFYGCFLLPPVRDGYGGIFDASGRKGLGGCIICAVRNH
jgi:dTDP-4-dehydrorhamnose reductase